MPQGKTTSKAEIRSVDTMSSLSPTSYRSLTFPRRNKGKDKFVFIKTVEPLLILFLARTMMFPVTF
jgi:hypothetical protein